MDPSSAVPATQQTGEQPLPAADRAARQPTIPSGVVRDHALVPLVLRPGNIALVVIHDQYVPLLAFPGEPTPDALAPVLDRDPAPRSAEGAGAAVDRVGQQSVNRLVDRKLPHHSSAGVAEFDRRQLHVLLPKPEMDLPDALELGELPEHEANCFLDPQIGVLGDTVVPDLHVADRDVQEQLAATCLLSEGFERALTQQRQLHFTEKC